MNLPALCSLLCMLPVGAAFAAQPTAYMLDVTLSPGSGEIRVAGTVKLLLDETDGEDLAFDLHRTFNISSLTVNNAPAEFTVPEAGPDTPASIARQVRISLPPGPGVGRVELSLAYCGRLSGFPDWGEEGVEGPYLDDEISDRRIELSLYSSWYPSFGFGAQFDSELAISPLPDGWKVACIGDELQETATGISCRGRQVNDLVIVASPAFRVASADTSAGRFTVYHTELPGVYVAREAQTSGQVLAFFSGVLGTPLHGTGAVKHIYSPRRLGQGGYARTGLTVYSEGRVLDQLKQNPAASNLTGMAHESGHFWWNFGSGQGDWLNESFAEYFSLLAAREIEGEPAFEAGMASCLEDVENLPDDAPAISMVPFSNDGHGYVIRYRKGALMLDHLRRLLGDEAFFEYSQAFYRKYRGERIGTAQFRAFWKSALGDDRHWVDAWLDSGGGLPDGTDPPPPVSVQGLSAMYSPM